MRSFLIGALAALLAAGASYAAEPDPARVKVQSGLLEGAQEPMGVLSFKDIPYAAAPVGLLRWRPPQAPASWTGVRKADRFGPLCMQKIVKDNGVGPGPASEDCLTLNVFAPTGTAGHGWPVMVWIHGGGFVNGSGTAALYDGSALTLQGVIVVTINYRLGRFGFFAHPALTAEQKGAPLANYGLMDQVAALRWVKRNIAAFGGDPTNVTIFGESAGGMSVNRLMMMRKARGLFAKAIVESGAGREPSQTLKQAEADGAAFAAKLGAGSNAADLRAIPADKIVAAGDLEIFQGEAPILDGRMLTESPMQAFAAGRVAKVPFLIGSNSLELPVAFAAGLKDKVVRLSPAELTTAEAAYGGADRFNAHVLSDVIFGEPARTLAADMARHGAPVFLYRFSVVSAGAPKAVQGGAVHASERQYVFRTLNASPWPTGANDVLPAAQMSAYWTAFARIGDPNGEHRPVWPRYGRGDRLLNFKNDGPVAEKTPDAAALDLIAATAAKR
jgi:para-nitrobenzyl esterase